MNAIIQSGSFTSDGTAKTLKLRSDVDAITVVNYTQHKAANNGYGVEYYWQLGMGTDSIMKYRPAGDQTLASNVSALSFQVVDSSNYALGAVINVTAGTNVTSPVYSTASTTGLANGSIVRVTSTAHTNLNGLDFTIGSLAVDTSFALANTLATAPGVIAGASGKYRLVAPNIDIYRLFAPTNRNIANITAAASAVVTTLVDHGYAIGQRVKFNIPTEYGMIELNGLTGNITAVSDSTFTVDVNSAAFTAFQFPITTETPFTPASVVPTGDNPGYASMMTAPGKFYNQGFIGVVLTGGTTGPAGNNGDVVYWYATKSERVDNE